MIELDFKAEIAAGLKLAGEAPELPPDLNILNREPAPPPAPGSPVVAPTGFQPQDAPTPAPDTAPDPTPTPQDGGTQAGDAALPEGTPVTNADGTTTPVEGGTAPGVAAAGASDDATAATQIAGGQNPNAEQPNQQQPQQQQGIADQAREWGNWAQENYLDLAAIPVGAALMLFGGDIGLVLGALAMGGGAYGLYERFNTLNNFGGEIAIPEGLTGEQAEEYRAAEIQRRWDAMAEAAQNEDTWNEWISDPRNAQVYQNLEMVHAVAPELVYDQLAARSDDAAAARGAAATFGMTGAADDWIRSQAAAELRRATGNRIGGQGAQR